MKPKLLDGPLVDGCSIADQSLTLDLLIVSCLQSCRAERTRAGRFFPHRNTKIHLLSLGMRETPSLIVSAGLNASTSCQPPLVLLVCDLRSSVGSLRTAELSHAAAVRSGWQTLWTHIPKVTSGELLTGCQGDGLPRWHHPRTSCGNMTGFIRLNTNGPSEWRGGGVRVRRESCEHRVPLLGPSSEAQFEPF